MQKSTSNTGVLDCWRGDTTVTSSYSVPRYSLNESGIMLCMYVHVLRRKGKKRR